MLVLVVNAGSSSLKLALLDGSDSIVASEIVSIDSDFPHGGRLDPQDAIASFIESIPPPDAAGHRIVHGGASFTGPALVDDTVLARIEELTPLAPLHQPLGIAGLQATRRLLPNTPSVACFDTAFHARLPTASATYALPEEWRTRWGLRRYGFHGLSHSYVSRYAAALMGAQDPRIVTCHLGAGSSLSAVHGDRSTDTTMGFTPLEGLVMATRSGSIDPGIILWLLEHTDLDSRAVAEALEFRSGLLALGGSADMREIVRRADSGEEGASLALEVYVHRLASSIAAMAAAMGGVDALVFTGGIGENSHEIRCLAARRCGFLGVAIDDSARPGDLADGHCEITAPGAPVRTFVVASREDIEIARHVRLLLG